MVPHEAGGPLIRTHPYEVIRVEPERSTILDCRQDWGGVGGVLPEVVQAISVNDMCTDSPVSSVADFYRLNAPPGWEVPQEGAEEKAITDMFSQDRCKENGALASEFPALNSIRGSLPLLAGLESGTAERVE